MTSHDQVPVVDTDKPGLLPRRFRLWVGLGLAALLLGITSLVIGVQMVRMREAVRQREAKARAEAIWNFTKNPDIRSGVTLPGGEDVERRRLKEQKQREVERRLKEQTQPEVER